MGRNSAENLDSKDAVAGTSPARGRSLNPWRAYWPREAEPRCRLIDRAWRMRRVEHPNGQP
jgi:hypothetical protein